MRIKLLIIILILFTTSCAIPVYHFDSDKEWIKRKEESFKNNQINWVQLNIPNVMPQKIYDYVGYKIINDKKLMTFELVDRIDYFHGYIYLRKKQDAINPFVKYIPLGFFSFEVLGIIGTEKEWISRPSLPAFIAQLAIMPLSYGIILAPTRVWEEECFHVSQEILHPKFTQYSKSYYYNISGRNTPIITPVLQTLLYYTNPMEIDAKIKKWMYFGFVFNLDCDQAWRRYNSLLTSIAYRKAIENNKKPTMKDMLVTFAYLSNQNYLNKTEIKPPSFFQNSVMFEAINLVGIIQRKPFEDKMIYAPWVPGVMREKEELPFFSKLIFSWLLNDEKYRPN